jgi:hypothetical protein
MEDETIRQFALYEKNFGWMVVWELNPEGWIVTLQTYK